MQHEKELTIITPSYNRAHTLQKVYESLKRQTNQSFIWMVVDDGSIDDTEQRVQSFIDKSEIEIKYIKKENGGKASAINLALDHLVTPYSTCLDSDDWFSERAVEIVLDLLHEEDSNEKCCGVLAVRSNPDGTCMGGREIPSSYKYIKTDDLYNKIGFSSELICFYKTSIVSQYRFPVYENEKFISSSWFHYKLCENYSFRTSWNCICYCEYMKDGLTKNKRTVIVKNPNGYTLIKKISLQHSTGMKRILKNAIMFNCGTILTGKRREWISDAPHKAVVILVYPLAVGVYFIRFRKLVNQVK